MHFRVQFGTFTSNICDAPFSDFVLCLKSNELPIKPTHAELLVLIHMWDLFNFESRFQDEKKIRKDQCRIKVRNP